MPLGIRDPSPKLLNDLYFFAIHHTESQDIDPVYPVLKWYYNREGFDSETALWFTTLYLAYYNLGSAATAFNVCPEFTVIPYSPELCTFPIATERRNLLGGKLKFFIDSYKAFCATQETQENFIKSEFTTDPINNYEVFWETSQLLWGNGRWATFKWAELLKEVHGFPLTAPDMRLQFCSGPKEGLSRLYRTHESASVAYLNHCAGHLQSYLAKRGLNLTWERLETVLCDFNSLYKGHYYVGHDIDQMQEQLSVLPRTHNLYRARLETIPHQYLGELHERSGIDKIRLKMYQQNGVILVR